MEHMIYKALLMLMLINTSFSKYKAVHICELAEKEINKECTKMSYNEVNKILLPQSACLYVQCERCRVEKKYMYLKDDWTITDQIENIFVSLDPNELGTGQYYQCKDRHNMCECENATVEQDNLLCQNEHCICELKPAKVDIKGVLNNEWISNLKKISFNNCEYPLEQSRITRSAQEYKEKEKLNEFHQEAIDEIIFQKGDLKLIITDVIMRTNRPATVIIRNDISETIQQINNSSIRIDPVFLLRSGRIHIIVIDQITGQLLKAVHTITKEVILCRKLECIICWQIYEQAACLPKTVRITIYALVIIIVSIAILYLKALAILLLKILWYTYMCIKISYRVLKSSAKCLMVLGVFTGTSARRKTDSTRNWLIEKRKSLDLQAGLVLLMIFTVLTSTEASCSNSEVLSADLIKCTSAAPHGGENCKVFTTAQVMLKNIGATSCLHLQHKTKGHVLSLEITLQKVQCTFDSQKMYYTFPVTLKTSAISRCATSNRCGWGIKCRDISNNDVYDHLWDTNYQEYTHWKRCLTSNFNEGCVIVTSSHCINLVNYIIPNFDYIYEVKRIRSFACNHIVKVVERSLNFSQELSFQVSTKTSNGISLSILGSLQQKTTMFNDLKWITRSSDKNENYLYPASENSLPIAGHVGSVQASSPFQKTNLTFAKEAITCQTFQGQVSCTYKQSVLNEIIKTSDHRLPRVIAYHQMSTDENNQLISELVTSSPVLIALRLENVKVTLQEANTCPQFSPDYPIVASGCYSCDPISELSFGAFSSCDIGNVKVYGEHINILTPYIKLTKKTKVFTVNFRSEIKCIKSDFCLFGTSSTRCRKLQFCLSEAKITLLAQNYTGSVPNMNNDFTDWTLNFDFFKNWLPRFRLFYIIGIIVAILISYGFLMSCCRR